MTTLREAAEKSLEMLEHFQNVTRIGSHDSNAWNHFHRERFMRADVLADETIISLRAALAAEQEQEKAYFDLMVYGTSVIKDGKRIDPKTLYIDSKTNTCSVCGKPLGSAGDVHTCSPQAHWQD